MPWKEFDYTQWKKENDKFDHKFFNTEIKRVLDEISDISELPQKTSHLQKPPFKPYSHYTPEGDKVDVFLTDEETFAKWICPGITVYLSHDTHDVVGIEICGIKK